MRQERDIDSMDSNHFTTAPLQTTATTNYFSDWQIVYNSWISYEKELWIRPSPTQPHNLLSFTMLTSFIKLSTPLLMLISWRPMSVQLVRQTSFSKSLTGTYNGRFIWCSICSLHNATRGYWAVTIRAI